MARVRSDKWYHRVAGWLLVWACMAEFFYAMGAFR